jgi:hypothetical protein
MLRKLLKGKPEGQFAIDIVEYNPGKIEECLKMLEELELNC